MLRFIRSISRTPAEAMVPVRTGPDIEIAIDETLFHGKATPCVHVGERVRRGDPLASGAHLTVHAPAGGMVSNVNEQVIRLEQVDDHRDAFTPVSLTHSEELPDFAAQAGLLGMGGGLFPYSLRFSGALKSSVKSLIINAVECEPGIQTDESIMLHESQWVFAAVERLQDLLDIPEIVLAVRRSTAERYRAVIAERKFRLLVMPDRYPGGAGKLIVKALTGRIPPAKSRLTHMGYMVMNVVSLWTFARRLLLGEPCLSRPMTVIGPDGHVYLVHAPLGISVGHLLHELGLSEHVPGYFLVMNGNMMGREVTAADRITQGTLSVFFVADQRRFHMAETPCILCGSCFDACPLGLHPIGMAQRIKEKRNSPSLQAQLNECFLCGACSAVCPANIPLVHYFKEGKKWM
ncbi:MAG: 4Fe-4S dicluster domain-containing protein [Spartobacteria bacterium]|nr:4Fe-4S dicluster domain-containing protein [Spartobacteria bacterium]